MKIVIQNKWSDNFINIGFSRLGITVIEKRYNSYRKTMIVRLKKIVLKFENIVLRVRAAYDKTWFYVFGRHRII